VKNQIRGSIAAVVFLSLAIGGIALARTKAYGGDRLQTTLNEATSIVPAGGAPVGPTKPVLVVNSPGDPVPVEGRIDIVNTPDVNVINTVRVFEQPKKPLNTDIQVSIPDGDTLDQSELFTVPDDKVLVVTAASASIGLPSGQHVNFRLDIENHDSTFILAIHHLPLVPSGPLVVGGPNGFSTFEPVSMIVPSGQKVTCRVLRDSDSGSAFGRCGISGYLVDADTP
jgi:hypothetical protein